MYVWEGKVVRHAARRFSLSGTAPPLEECDDYPVRPVASYPIADRPFLTRDLPRQLIFWDAKRAVLVRSVREQSRVACASEEP